MTSVFYVIGMDCMDEVRAIEKSLKHPLVTSVEIVIVTSKVTVEHAPLISRDELIKLINKSGVKVRDTDKNSHNETTKNHVRIIISAGTLFTTALLGEWFFNFPRMVVLFFSLTAALTSGLLVFPKSLRAIKSMSLDMNVLMAMACIGAFAIGEYVEAAAVVFLFSLAELLESMSVMRARSAVRELLEITPEHVLVYGNDGECVEKSPRDVVVGSEILIRAFDKIALDGEILEGQSQVNQATLTGESMPVFKTVGDLVYAGTVNGEGTLKIKSIKTFEDTKLSHIIKLIETAQSGKAPAQKFVNRFAKVYTPTVTLVAFLVCVIPPLFFSGVWSEWIYRSLVFLVTACPCALVISTPVAIVSGLTSLARRGVLIKGGAYLENLANVKAWALDKTGTLTEGMPKVVSNKIFEGQNSHNVFDILLSLETLSTHPLAQSLVDFSLKNNARKYIVSGFKVMPGLGVLGQIDGHSYLVGNLRMAKKLNMGPPQFQEYIRTLENKGTTIVVVGDILINRVTAVLELVDPLKQTSIDVIKKLYQMGASEIVILSGDNQQTVDNIAGKLKIKNAYGNLLPEDKFHKIQELRKRHHKVAMLGDGINDAAALAHADIGISMGIMGSDLAIETSDIILANDDLSLLTIAIEHSKKCLKIIRFNIFFALMIKAIFLVLGVLGYANLWLAVAADTGASLLVIFNSLRLLKIK